MFSPPVAKAIAFVVAAAVFIGGMLIVAVFVAAPFSTWAWGFTNGWSNTAKVGAMVALIGTLYALGFYFRRRDHNSDRAAR